MSTTAETLAILGGPCGYCAGYHTGICPRVKRITYHGNGTVASVEFFDTAPAAVGGEHGSPSGEGAGC